MQSKTSANTRQRILETGARLIHKKGFNHTGIKEILDACDVPKGSFYFYFKSKEEFGLAVIDFHFEQFGAISRTIFDELTMPPIARLRAYFETFLEGIKAHQCEMGCPLGNLVLEMSDLSPAMREKLQSGFTSMEHRLTHIIQQAIDRGDITRAIDPNQTAQWLMSGWQGAVLYTKLTRSTAPIEAFFDLMFKEILV
ncbi:TetR/AcrR family transcriptional regulator [Desulfovibrio inopinatus]|uniref:TetR/AcrR family transcriptional regulator n=1 Tax=Desulfovibrio inopinatus TaxID=102109 RepID=UPI000426578E|nr:TetR/AcrR family transcriptional regulator [Desulfovibrio inopinatus]